MGGTAHRNRGTAARTGNLETVLRAAVQQESFAGTRRIKRELLSCILREMQAIEMVVKEETVIPFWSEKFLLFTAGGDKITTLSISDD